MTDTCPEKPFDKVFPQVRDLYSNPLRSRARRVESCWGRLLVTFGNAF
jgi:hypothetical protein